MNTRQKQNFRLHETRTLAGALTTCGTDNTLATGGTK